MRLRKSRTTQPNEPDPANDPFDAEVIRSALLFELKWREETAVKANSQVSGPTAEQWKEMAREIAREAYGWLPKELIRRAQMYGASTEGLNWLASYGNKPADVVEASRAVKFFQHAIVWLMADAPSTWTWNRVDIVERSAERIPVSKWLDRELEKLSIWQRFVFQAGTMSRATLPLITTVPRCLVYAVAILASDREMRSRLRECPFGTLPNRERHYFFDYRRLPDGKFTAGVQPRFCSPAHLNAYKQAQKRERDRERAKQQEGST